MRQGGTLRHREALPRSPSKGLAAQRRRRSSADEKPSILGETRQAGIVLSGVPSEHGMPSRLLLGCNKSASAWRSSKQGEPVVSVSAFRELQFQVTEMQRQLKKKLLEIEILKEALEVARQSSDSCAHRHRR
jgi:transposase